MARLFQDSGICNTLGQSVSLGARNNIKKLIEQTLEEDPDVDLRELQLIVHSVVDSEISRAIVVREMKKRNS